MEQRYCPLSRGDCSGERCIFWVENDCRLRILAEMYAPPPSILEEIGKEEEPKQVALMKLEKASAEELSEELVKFTKEQFPAIERSGIDLYRAKDAFWLERGVESTSELEPQIRLKIRRAEMLAERKLEREKVMMEKARVEEEKKQLPALIDECVMWAKSSGLSRVTKSNIQAFLAEKEIELSDLSIDILYTKTNQKLKPIGVIR